MIGGSKSQDIFMVGRIILLFVIIHLMRKLTYSFNELKECGPIEKYLSTSYWL